jgi:glutamate-ammonia-ligase adenylyltransferase
MDQLRHFKHRATFHVLAQDLAGMLTVEDIGDDLSLIADLALAATLAITWESLRNRHRDAPAFAIVGYGKLGGKEMGYASDLDLVFLYDDPAPGAPDVYARLAQRMNAWLSAATPAGVLYDTDLRLRPDGAAGLMVSSLPAFEEYQKARAWSWEHQALTRARFVAGDTRVGAEFARVRRDLLLISRDVLPLRAQVLEMRRKMHEGHPNASDLFDIKHDPGGLVDVEFVVQFLVLAHAHAHPELADNRGNIELLRRAGAAGLLPPDEAQATADAYRELRRLQHAARLAGAEHARVPRAQAGAHPDTVLGLWKRVFGN